jgi:hypothetical protein
MGESFGLENGLMFRTARKTHRCNGDGSASHRHAVDCAREIQPGEQYVECFWDTPAYQSGSRVSMACARAFYGVEAQS